MEKIQKIKLMMGYDLSKTLNENVESLDIIIENETNINEQGKIFKHHCNWIINL